MLGARDLKFHIATLHDDVTDLMPPRPSRIGADVGGTFTDVIALDADGTARISKVLSTPPDYDTAVVQAVILIELIFIAFLPFVRGVQYENGQTRK